MNDHRFKGAEHRNQLYLRQFYQYLGNLKSQNED